MLVALYDIVCTQTYKRCEREKVYEQFFMLLMGRNFVSIVRMLKLQTEKKTQT